MRISSSSLFSFCAAVLLVLVGAWTGIPARADTTSNLVEWRQLPSMGSPAAASLTPGKVERLGAGAVRALRYHGLVLNDPQVRYYLQTIGNRLAAHAPRVPFKIIYIPIRNPTLNSFALPGGYIGIQSGLVVRTRDEDELAAVMAHETGHEVQRHIARQIVQNKNLGAISIATILAAAAVGVLTGSPNVGIAAMGASGTVMMQKQINYTRQDEEEADRVGIRMLAAAGFDPDAMASFFSYLAQYERLQGGVDVPAILLNHPVTSERIADAKARASEYPDRKPTDDLAYRLIRARCRVLASPNLDATISHYQGTGLKDPADRYGLVLAWAMQGKLDKAHKMLAKLLGKYPDNVHIRLEMAKILQMQGHVKKSLARFRQLKRAAPDYPPMDIAYANALEQADKFEEARGVLVRSKTKATPQFHHLRAVAANRTDRPVEARYQLALYYFMQGEYEPAIQQLQSGLKKDGLSKKQHARLQDKLKQVQKAASHRR